MVLLRRFISLFIAVEMLFSALFTGADVIGVKMPETNAGEYGKYVDPFVGTGGIPWACAMLSPAATVPFGNIRLGPDTSVAGGLFIVKTNTSGYYYEHRHILGFSYGRLSGTGIHDYGMFRVTPSVGKSFSAKPGDMAFSHRNEVASPGYYAVYLPGAAAMCEMTATEHSGFQRYTFDTSKDAKLYIDASSYLADSSTKNSKIEYNPETGIITGETEMYGGFSDRFSGMKIYYYAKFDCPVKTCTAHTADGDTDANRAEGDEAGLLFNFGNIENKPITLKAGISYVSLENAGANLDEEAGNLDFDGVRNAASENWESRLSKIKIEATEEIKTIFYTSLYHTMIMPSDFTDYNGEYVGFDKRVHTADGFTYRTDMSLWDTCRNVHSLYSLIAGDVQKDCLNSLLLMADQGGTLPRWPMGEGYTGSMFANPADIIFTESYLKDFDFDAEKALRYMIKSSETLGNREDREWADLFAQYKYIPDDLVRNGYRGMSVARTIEYSWDDAAISVLAEKLGQDETAEKYRERSLYYRNLWDPETRYFRARNSDGSWGVLKPNMTAFYDDILGLKYSKAYCEGSARQWRWGAVHDVDGLVELFGSKEYFVSELEDFMEDASPSRAALNPGAGFWIGNQHDIHTPYLFNAADRPDLTQKWVRWTLKNRYSTDIDGLDGNDDGGTLSTWYVFSAMGFYPVAGSDRYWVGSPCIKSAEITLDNGEKLTVRVDNYGEDRIYVDSISINGEKLNGTEFAHSDISGGGEIVFSMK